MYHSTKTILCLVRVLVLVLLSAPVLAEPPLEVGDWKMKVKPLTRYSLSDKVWDVDVWFENISNGDRKLLLDNGALMYRVRAVKLGQAAGENQVVERSDLGPGVGSSAKNWRKAVPGGVVQTKCDIRWMLKFNQAGRYEIRVERLLSTDDASRNFHKQEVKNTIKSEPFVIEVIP